MINVGTQPAWPTTLRSRLADGRLQGTDGSLWLYRAVPLSPVVDARSPAEALDAASPLMAMFEELSDQANATLKFRRMAKGAYRQVHLLLVNVPVLYNPGPEHELSAFLRESYKGQAIDRRILLFGVRLRDKITSGGMKQAIDSVVETLVAGQTPLADFDEDTRKINAAMDRSGLLPLTESDVALANAWWNHGRSADTPMLFHTDHIHVLPTAESVRMAERAGFDECATWTPASVPGAHAITFTSARDLKFNFISPESPAASWVTGLMDSDALVVSVRGLVEPGTVTREELRRQRKRFIHDIQERQSKNKMSRQEQDEMLGLLTSVEGFYGQQGQGGNPPPTLTSASVVVGFNGQYRDVSQIIPAAHPVALAPMDWRQNGALAETWLCSNLRANPILHDLPVQVVGYSGLPSLSFCGDADGALLGFSEKDRQPSYISPTAASKEDAGPLLALLGGTGSGKTQALMWLCAQWARSGKPVVLIDPKAMSDLAPAVLASDGQIISLDDLISADGIFDPLRFSTNEQVGIELAAAMLGTINPWGSRRADMEVPLQHALNYGVGKGATCTGQALMIAQRDLDHLPHGMVQAVLDLAQSSAMFRACVGINPQSAGLSVHKGLTLIKVGSTNLDLPDPGSDPDTAPVSKRIGLALVRMMVFGSAMALAGQGGGVLGLDEAWTFLGAGRSEVERLGRLGRSQKVLAVLATQRVTDATRAGLTGYISRGLILGLPDPSEAHAACELFELEPTPTRIARLTAKATHGAASDRSVAPNWNSMRALRDPVTGEVLRGSVAIHVDLAGRAVPCEVVIPDWFFKLASTNPEDIARRERESAARLQQQRPTAPTAPAPSAYPAVETPASGTPHATTSAPPPGAHAAPSMEGIFG